MENLQGDENCYDQYKFSVLVDAKDFPKPIHSHNLSFIQLIEEVVEPYENNKSFFIDGVRLKSEFILRLKIIKQDQYFAREMACFFHAVRSHSYDNLEAYSIRIMSIFRQHGDDVTSKVVNAYEEKVKPKTGGIIETIDKKKELIGLAFNLFIEWMKFHSGK